MHALILGSEHPGATHDLTRPIAGAPLLERQLEWLQGAGIKQVVIHRVAADKLPLELHAERLAELGMQVTWIPTAGPLQADQLAKRAGLSNDDLVVVIPHATLGSLDPQRLAEALGDHELQEIAVGDAVMRIARVRALKQTPARVEADGWLCVVRDELTAHALNEQILSGQQAGIVVRGTQVSDGIWRARGAVVVEGAELEPPCYLGRGCFVADGARLGPGAVIGAGAVIESRARVVHARIADSVVVGQGVLVERACAMPGRIERHVGRTIEIDDDLLISGGRREQSWAPRLAAAAALGLVGPASVIVEEPVSTLFRRLVRVVEGTGAWIGVRTAGDEDAVVIDVLPLLVPPGAEREECEAATALYQAKKSTRFDGALLLGRLFQSGDDVANDGDP